jgi:putative thioredoxin
MEELTVENFFEVISASGDLLIVDVYAEWCAPCGRLMKILPNLADELKGRASIVKANIDKMRMLKDVYEVKSIPTFLFFKDGQIIHRFDGIKTLAEIREIVDKLVPLPQPVLEETVYAKEEISS